MNIKFKYLLISVLIIIGIIASLLLYINNLNKIISQKDDVIAISVQNENAFKDQLKMVRDSIQNYAVFVLDLQNGNNNLNSKYIILSNKYKILIDSIQVLNKPATVDTTNNTIIVKFSGKERRISYDGNTTYYRLQNRGTYSITISGDTLFITDSIYIDKNDSLIKNKIYANGEMIANAKTEVDSAIYLLFRKYSNIDVFTPGFFDNLKVSLSLNESFKKENNIYKPHQVKLNAGAEYQFNLFKIYGNKDLLSPDFDLGVKVQPSVRQLWNVIF